MVFAFACALFSSGLFCGAAEERAFAPEQIEFFEKKIRPVLVEHCYKCHSPEEKIKGGLVLDSRSGVLKGGDGGPAVVSGEPEKSLLIQAIRYGDEELQMPPKHRLTPEQVRDFEEWVRLGLPDPRDGSVVAQPAYAWEAVRNFWSFRPVTEPSTPNVQNTAWARGEIDRFLLAQLEPKGLTPNPDSDRRTLLRRVTYDLTGLPPKPEEMRDFLSDTAPDAFEKVVERLLASPHYGEQWGRHWLDVVRYADTSGCNSDYPVPSAYRYRNYVVDSFNRDKPYDQFLREQIAGDLLPAATDEEHYEKVVATGYLALARRFGSRANEFHLTIEDAIDNLGKATLGLSLGCARCHDHKFDPVPARDYYALYGIFDSSRFAFPGTEIYPRTRDFTPLLPKEEAAIRLAQAAEASDLDQRIEDLKNEKKQLERSEKKAAESQLMPVANSGDSAAAVASKPAMRTAADAKRDLEAAIARQKELVAEADRYPKAYAVSEGKPHNAQLHRKGDPANKGDEVPRGFLTILGGQTVPPDEKGSGRLQLAEWLTAPDNPLTARVMVNRIWQHHFGRGLVKTPNDFGVRGEAPTHPELLDWLAQQFIESGWSIKAMHRLIVHSRAYQMSSEDNPECSAKDVANDSFWRFNRRRLSAEEIRDSILAVSTGLDSAIGGQHPFAPELQWKYTQHKPFVAHFETSRRSLYMMQQRIRKHPYLELFDGADPNATTAVRPTSTTPIQALWMLNNELAHAEAVRLAERLSTEFSDETARISRVIELVLCRPAEEAELQDARHYLAKVSGALDDAEVPPDQRSRAALGSFTRVLFSTNEFVFVD
jgi:hypothetical protein